MGHTGLKVLHVGPKNFPPNHGGVEKVVYDIVTGMEHVESHVLTEWGNGSSKPRVEVLKPGVVAAFRQIQRYCHEHDINLVHLHKESFIPHALLLSLAGVKCVLTIHGCSWRLARWPVHYRAGAFVLDCLACLCGPRVVFVGRRDWVFFKRVFFFRRVCLIQNGVGEAVNSSSVKNGQMVYLGRLSPEKNILTLIRASESEGIELDLYGPFDKHDPKFRESVLDLLQTCTHVRWLGGVPFDRVRETISAYRIFVNLSYSEGLPISVLEAAAEGLYLVLSDIPQHRLLNLPACAFVSPDRPIFAGLFTDARRGIMNREHVRKAFSLDKMVREYVMLYEEILCDKGPRMSSALKEASGRV